MEHAVADRLGDLVDEPILHSRFAEFVVYVIFIGAQYATLFFRRVLDW